MITMGDFVPEEHPILREVADQVQFPLDDATKQLADDMLEFLINSQDEELAEKYQLRAGVGLAAPQIGVGKQIFAIHLMEYDEEGEPVSPIISQVMFNPKIISHSVENAALQDGEGCLSVNRNVPGFVPRPRRVKFSYQNENGEKQVLRLRDYEAIVVQHELDHLKGIMFYDHIDAKDPWAKKPNMTII
ncbi:peptide deformylase [Fundicoccus culcitae]|uniref:Peptide deformylase n=1 Tax=Fundicoccus culcitae TaxID=2969821 RepID=A0ABY5P6T5_9LACT|nr:peptide deformylase [Fundicoccus culcitae]UUX34259.1 peptide deformylase [Fundicoccus culcitae]